MSRTTRLKLAYAFLMLGTFAIGGLWVALRRPPAWQVVAVGVVLLLPARIQGHFYRDLFRGRALLQAERYADAIPHFERFLELLAGRPALKRLLWLSWSVYSLDPEVMTLNNLGAAHLALGNLSNARSHLERAARLDPAAPLVQFNLALLAHVEGNHVDADIGRRRAKELGLGAGWDDRFVELSQRALAAVEGRMPAQGSAKS